MSSAEQGGNQPQRVLLIGGPKHGEFMNLSAGQKEYKFVSERALLPPTDGISRRDAWMTFPRTAEHIYRFDPALTAARQSLANIFTHEVLWNSPYQGGFNLHALTEAYKALETAKDDLQRATDRSILQNKMLKERQDENSDLREQLTKADDRLGAIRILLERIGWDVMAAANGTGKEYASWFEQSPPKP